MSVKATIPKALREQVWLKHVGKVYSAKCRIVWCQNTMTVFDFQSGHDVPESKGGPTTLANMVVICSRCNLSMGNQYTFTEWSQKHYIEVKPKRTFSQRWFGCFFQKSCFSKN